MLRYFWPSDDEQLAGQWQDSHFDEDGSWWANVQQCGATLALAATLVLTAASTSAAVQAFSQSQDDPAGSLSIQQTANEEYWQNSVPPLVWPQASVFTDDDVHPTFVQVFTPDDGDYWHQLVPPVVDSNYIRLPFLDPEEIPQLPTTVPVVDDQSPWAPQVPPAEADITILVFLDDGSWVPALEPDEDFLPVQAIPVPWNWPQPAQPFAIADEQVPQFPAEDDFWPQYVAPDPGGLIWPQQWPFEQNESTNLVAFTTEEHSWPIPIPVPDSIWLLRQDAFEQTDATGSLTLTLDDSFQPLVIPGVPFPDPGNLGLLQQWPFEQNEPAGSLRNNVDEDYWLNPVAPVNWPQPNVLTADESIEQFVAVFQVDEDFWQQLVQPVPATNFLAPFTSLAGGREEDTPVLVPPVPVVPCFMPLPPSGPDKDTAISVFTQGQGPGNRAVLALFCRICKSGNPLVVRGDYAIWCQDCCAFVSKQDTFMGTVQAPGQFRGRF